ncbi:hypothetical protein ACIQ9E_01835 [Streptomyces sp. NPDC094448]|uniref:hypothetical protein n=1 Tax=Streptomyces sp. NPDC094448 TaxID=3366063 RepID=UPI003807DB66
MQGELIDGVPVLWTEEPGPFEAVLIFGGGILDEPLAVRGAMRLVAHLAQSALPRRNHPSRDWQDLESTYFTASGSPEQVTRYLDGICRALARLPLHRLAHEAEVLGTADLSPVSEVAQNLLWGRYGHTGPGSANHEGPGLHGVSAEDVRSAAARVFHRDNAALVLTGPPPEGLRLPLPAGERPAVRAAAPEVITGAVWFPSDVPDPGMSWSGDPGDPALLLSHYVFRERLVQALRHRNGLSHEIRDVHLPLGPGRAEFIFWPDSREGHEQRVAELMWQEALRLASEDPTEAELAREVTAYRERAATVERPVDELLEAAGCLLVDRDYQDLEARLESLAQVAPEQLRAAFATALKTAVLTVPNGLHLELPQLDGRPVPQLTCNTYGDPAPGAVFRPKRTDRLRYRDLRGAQLVLTDDGIWHRAAPDDVHYVAFAEASALIECGNGRLLLGGTHCVIDVDESLYPGAARASAAADAAVPPRLRFRAPGFREE